MHCKYGKLFVPLFVAIFLTVGCSAVYIAGYEKSPDGRFYVNSHIRGAYGHSFLDETKKEVCLSITRVSNVGYANDKTNILLQKKYSLLGSDISWDALWDTHENVTITFFDYGPGVFYRYAEKNHIPKRTIYSVSFHFDSETGKFVEKP